MVDDRLTNGFNNPSSAEETPPPNPLPEAERGRRVAHDPGVVLVADPPVSGSPSPLRGGGWGGGCWNGRFPFEALVREARAAAASPAPRLIEARYRASLGEGQALVGTAQWKVLHQGSGPALLRLQAEGQPFNLAVKQPRYENRDAVIAEFPDP